MYSIVFVRLHIFKLLLAILIILACATCAIKPNEAITEETYITRAQAEYIAKTYAERSNWGSPIDIRLRGNKYIFSYDTPSEESASIGGRVLYVDIISGKVTLPMGL